MTMKWQLCQQSENGKVIVGFNQKNELIVDDTNFGILGTQCMWEALVDVLSSSKKRKNGFPRIQNEAKAVLYERRRGWKK